ncbi:MAG TPA: hypothetical protein VMD52_06775 [Patescibacteria group bacterium]|nr:hypothetical protein [Patescibacteria group bacterium]
MRRIRIDTLLIALLFLAAAGMNLLYASEDTEQISNGYQPDSLNIPPSGTSNAGGDGMGYGAIPEAVNNLPYNSYGGTATSGINTPYSEPTVEQDLQNTQEPDRASQVSRDYEPEPAQNSGD